MKHYFFLIATLFYTSAFLSCEGATLHAIIVADTQDGSVGDIVQIDFDKLSDEIARISEYTELSLNMKVFKSKFFSSIFNNSKFNIDAILNHIENLEVDPDDAIVFYYLGHGFRTEDKPTQWPVMFFGWKECSLDLFTAATFIQEKNPRFALVLAECCNSFVDDDVAPAYKGITDTALRSDAVALMHANYKRLFIESEGLLLISASSVGEYGWGIHERGSCYTGSSFLPALQIETRTQPAVTWDDVLERADELMEIFNDNILEPETGYTQHAQHAFFPRAA